MKAEHRKELETNLLADRMGTLIQKMKGGSQRRLIWNGFWILLACFVLFIIYRFWQGDAAEAASRWMKLYMGDVVELANDADDNNTKKAARLELAQWQLWHGVRYLAAKPVEALKYVDKADEVYEGLETQCTNDKDKEWLAEAQYGRAVVAETLAVVDPKKLAGAIEKYEDLASKLPGTTRGAVAKARAKDLTENGAKLTDFYKRLNEEFRLIPRDLPRAPALGVPGFGAPQAAPKPGPK